MEERIGRAALAPSRPQPPDLLALFDASARRFGDRAAHVSPAGAVTYAALWGASARAAEALRPLIGGARGAADPILVYGHKEPAVLAAFLGAARLGRPYVPADVSAPAERVLRMADLAGVAAAVATAGLPAALEEGLARRRIPVLRGAALLAPGGFPEPAPDAAPDALAYILFTSGSSGDPKGVPIRRRSVAHFADWLLTEQRPRPGAEVVLNQAPFSFDLSVMDLCLALGSGGTLWSVTREQLADPRALFASLGASGCTVWVSTPSFARFCLAEPSFTGAGLLPELRRLIFCGEPLPPAVAAELLRRFPGAEVWNTYGPTETTVAVTSVRVTQAESGSGRPLPVGRPAPGMRVWVAGDDLAPVPDGEAGEIVIAGPQVSPGYLAGSAAGSATRFCDLPGERGGGRAYRTGDSGRVREGLLYCEGRLDRQVKLHGYRLELDEIEAHLRRLPAVADAAVLPVWRNGAPDHLVAFVATREAAPAPEGALAFSRAQALRAELGRTLPAYAVPRILRLVPELPLTANGKVDRRALEARL